MFQLLKTFAALSMAGSVVLSLLPQGVMRRTAAMVIGLLTMLCWFEGLMDVLHLPDAAETPETVLTASGIDLEEAARQTAALLEGSE